MGPSSFPHLRGRTRLTLTRAAAYENWPHGRSGPPRMGLGQGAALQVRRGLGEHVTENSDHLVELLLARDERRGDLDHRVASVVGAADEAALEQRTREEAPE